MKRAMFVLVLVFGLAGSVFAQPAIQWQRSLGGSAADWAYSIQQTADEGYIVAGWSDSHDGDVTGNCGFSRDCWVVKLNSSGDIQWQKSLGGSSSDEANSIQQTSDGGYIVAGWSCSNNGDVTGNHGDSDYWVVKLAPDVGIREEAFIPAQFYLTAHPNPFNSACRISTHNGATVEIFNLSGQLVYTNKNVGAGFIRQWNFHPAHTLASEEKGNHKDYPYTTFVWQPDKNIPTGVYLIRASLGKESETKQVIYLK